MKPIKINEANLEKINKAIDEAEGRATVRRIGGMSVLNAVKEIEEHFDIPKKLMTGIMVDVDINAQNFPKAYKYTPESTQFIVLRKKSGWYLMGVTRDNCRVPSKKFLKIGAFTEEQKNAIMDKFYMWE